MIANRFLGNPIDRHDNGGLRNRQCYGSRTEAPSGNRGDRHRNPTVHARRISIQTTCDPYAPKVQSSEHLVSARGA
jgi:hypothetical protein